MLTDPDGRESTDDFKDVGVHPEITAKNEKSGSSNNKTKSKSRKSVQDAAKRRERIESPDDFTSVRQRHNLYGRIQNILDERGNGSQWFGAAEIVTDFNALGGAEFDPGLFIDFKTGRFLIGGNKFLFGHNFENAKSLLDDGKLDGTFTNAEGKEISFDGLEGIELDYALVEFEQSLVQDFIKIHESKIGSNEMKEILGNVNELFSSEILKPFQNNLIKEVMNKSFNGGSSFNFANFQDRVTLGKRLIDKLHQN